MNRRLLAMYPRAWRERYGAEAADLADELISNGETTSLRATLDFVASAAVEWWRVLTSRTVLTPLVAALTVLACVAVSSAQSSHNATATRPYYDTHRVGVLLPIAELAWLLVELAELWRGRRARRWRDRSTLKDQLRLWFAVGACVVVGTMLVDQAPSAFPAATIRPGVVAFVVGITLLVAGIGLRRWSFTALRGRYLNFSVVIRPDQPVVATGPYRLLRHPGNAGVLLICIGAGLASANWVGTVGSALLPLTVVIWRIRAEENALLTTLGDAYRRYASDHKRLVPLIW